MVSEQSAILAKPTTWDALYPTEEEIEELRKSMPASSKKTPNMTKKNRDMSFSPDIEIGHGDVIAVELGPLRPYIPLAISQIISVSATRKSKAYLLAITSWGGARQ